MKLFFSFRILTAEQGNHQANFFQDLLSCNCDTMPIESLSHPFIDQSGRLAPYRGCLRHSDRVRSSPSFPITNSRDVISTHKTKRQVDDVSPDLRAQRAKQLSPPDMDG